MNSIYLDHLLTEEAKRFKREARKREPWHNGWEQARRERLHLRLNLAALHRTLQRLVVSRLRSRKVASTAKAAH